MDPGASKALSLQLPHEVSRLERYSTKVLLACLEETHLATVSVPESDFFSAKEQKKVPHLFNGNPENFL
jgi:hypothetical protein